MSAGDSDFIPLVNKLKEYGKTVFVVGGKAFTSTILQQNCHEFVSYESLLSDADRGGEARDRPPRQQQAGQLAHGGRRPGSPNRVGSASGPRRWIWRKRCRWWSAPCKCWSARAVQPQLGLLKSTMLQLDSAFTEKAYGANSFFRFRRES